MGITQDLSPDVAIAEFDLTQTVEAAAVAAAAVVGEFNWGPVDEIKTISTESKLSAMFGIPTNTVYQAWFSAKNFLEYSRNLKIVRVTEGTPLNSTADGNGIYIANESVYSTNYEDGSASVGSFAAKYAGALGDSLKIQMVDSHTYTGLDGNTVVITDAGSGYVDGSDDGVAVTFSAPDDANGTTATGTLNVESNVVTGITMTNSGSGYTSSDTITVTIPDAVGGGSAATATIDLWQYKNQFLTNPGTSDFVSAKGGSNDELHIIIFDEDGAFTGTKGAVLEKFPFVSKASDAKRDDGTSSYYKNVLRDQSQYIYWMDHPTAGTDWGNTGIEDFESLLVIEQASLTGGDNGTAVTNTSLMPGWDLFKNKDEIDVGLLITGDADNVLKNYIIQSIAAHRRDAVAFISPNMADVVYNVGSETEDIITVRNVLTSSSYAVFDGNWKYQFDVHNDTFRWLPCNADIAGLCARVDYDRDPWWSPAGYNRGHIKNVVKFAWNPDKTDRDELFPNGINPVLSFYGEGAVLFGDKTMLTKHSAFDRINVRRLFIVLEKSIGEAAKYMLFEFNDPSTRLKFKLMVEPFLRQVQGGRGIEDWKVVCDESNNTPQVIQSNSFVGDIFVKPNYSISFIHLNFIATPTGIDFTTAIKLQNGGVMV